MAIQVVKEAKTKDKQDMVHKNFNKEEKINQILQILEPKTLYMGKMKGEIHIMVE